MRPIRQIRLIGQICLIGLISPVSVLAENFSSTNFVVENPVIEPLGGLSTSTNFSVQPASPYISPGQATSSNFQLNPGFFSQSIVTVPTLTLTNGPNADEVKASWTVSQGALATNPYEVGYGTVSGSYSFPDPAQSATTKLVTGLNRGTTYYFIVRVKDAANRVVAVSSEVSIATISAGSGGSGGNAGGGGGSGSGVSEETASDQALASSLDTAKEVLLQIAKQLFPVFFQAPEPAEIAKTELERFVPLQTPLVFTGQWQLFPSNPIREFVLKPLPENILRLARAFPQLGTLFKSVGLTRFQDLGKLAKLKLALPGLGEVLALPAGLKNLSIPSQLAELSSQFKAKIPSDILFAATADGKIDLGAKAQITKTGELETRVRATAGKTITLALRPAGKPVAIKGYVIFKKRISPISPISLIGPIKVALAAESEIETALVLQEFEFTDEDGDGVYLANIDSPLVAGDYEILTLLSYQEGDELVTKTLKLITVIDPEGYIYELRDNRELRISGAIVELNWLNPETKAYESWPAADFAQENPQTTPVTGEYSFLVPPGFYSLKITVPGYSDYEGKPFEVREGGSVHENIALTSGLTFWRLIDWRTLAIIFLGALLLVNFYRDKINRTNKSNWSN